MAEAVKSMKWRKKKRVLETDANLVLLYVAAEVEQALSTVW